MCQKTPFSLKNWNILKVALFSLYIIYLYHGTVISYRYITIPYVYLYTVQPVKKYYFDMSILPYKNNWVEWVWSSTKLSVINMNIFLIFGLECHQILSPVILTRVQSSVGCLSINLMKPIIKKKLYTCFFANFYMYTDLWVLIHIFPFSETKNWKNLYS